MERIQAVGPEIYGGGRVGVCPVNRLSTREDATLPPTNKGLIADLIKGNQWVT